MSNRRKVKPSRGQPAADDHPPADTLIPTGIRAAQVASPDDEPMYGLEIRGVTLDAPDQELTRSFILDRATLHALVAELHKAEGTA